MLLLLLTVVELLALLLEACGFLVRGLLAGLTKSGYRKNTAVSLSLNADENLVLSWRELLSFSCRA